MKLCIFITILLFTLKLSLNADKNFIRGQKTNKSDNNKVNREKKSQIVAEPIVESVNFVITI
jgi:hypothetical protein